MMRTTVFVLLMVSSTASAQSVSDSITLSMRWYGSPPPSTHYWTGQFNGWNPTAWPMLYQGDHWLITRTFRIHAPSDPNRTLGDSVYQYKFTSGPAGSTTWNTDPLNPEQNPLDNSNSILRLSRLFWFQYYQFEASQQITKVAVGLGHSNGDSVTSVTFTTAETNAGPFSTVDITNYFNRTTRVVNYPLPAPIARSSYVRLVARVQTGDSIVYAKGGYVVSSLPMPPAALHGVTIPALGSGDSTTFRLRVSGKDVVLLHIAPAGESPGAAPGIVMRKNTSTPSDWWMNVALAPGSYEYLYEINAGTLLPDPWGREIGQYGTKFTVGPEGRTADNYVWQSNGYQRPPLEKIIVYELNVGEFAGGYFGKTQWWDQGTFLELATLMGHFDSLGVNAIELMPVNDYGNIGLSGHSWGYDLNSYFALEPGYGTPAEFKALVDSAHAHGIAIIVDVVYNHLNETSALWLMQPDVVQNPYFKNVSDLRYNEDNLAFFKDMDHWTVETQELVLASLKMWIDEYHVDGFRYDFTQGIGWNVSEPSVGILGWANAIAVQYNNTVYQIAEHLPESPALVFRSGLTGGWHDSFRDKLFDEARFKNVSAYEIRNLAIGLGAFPGNDTPSSPSSYGGRTEPVNATVTHDEQSLIYEMTMFQGVNATEALNRDKLYGTLMFTSLGIPMLWEGMELGESRGFQNGGEKLAYRPVNAALRNTVAGQSHFGHYQTLAHHRSKNPALTNGRLVDLLVINEYPTRKVIAWGLQDTISNSTIVVAANFLGTEVSLTDIPWPGSGTWYDIFDQSSIQVSGVNLSALTIAPYTARVFSNKSNAELGILTDIASVVSDLPQTYELRQNFPNPFNPTTTIQFALPRENDVTLKVFNMLGQEVTTVVAGRMSAGVHSFTFDAARLASGMYVYKVVAGEFTSLRKMLLVK